MKDYLKKLPKDMRDLIYLAGRIAKKTKVNAYLVGGVVRDLILGVTNFDTSTSLNVNPEHSRRIDLDMVVEGQGLSFASEFARQSDARLTIHPRFDTATLITPKKIKLDIATARLEVYPEPACLPVVQPGTIRDDLARRDFTINTLAIDLLPKNFGNLVDFYHGRKDLKAKTIRILHDASFIDDPTRIIRAVRFEQRFKFRIEPHTMRLLRQAAARQMLKRVSPHRLRNEIMLILKEDAALSCILRLNKIVGFNFIHQNLKLNKANLEYLTAIKKEIDWFSRNFPGRSALDIWLMYFMGLLRGLKKAQINSVLTRLGLRREDIKRIISYNKISSAKLSRLSKKNISLSQIYRELKPLSFEVILLIKARYRNRTLNLNIEKFFKYCSRIQLYLDGKDLTVLGLRPGPNYKKILNQLLYLQLDGKINSREAALKYLKKWLSLS